MSGKLEEKSFLPSSSPFHIRPPRLNRSEILRFLTPTYLSKNGVSAQDVVRPTDFLDGMRGFAAFAVFFCHFAIPAHPKIHTGYGGGHGDDDHWVGQLPIIRLVMSGQMCVFLFFVISGFSISLKPLKLARRGQYTALFDALFSATFRRAARLYLPCVAALFITLLLVCLGQYSYAQTLQKNWPFPGDPLPGPKIFNSNYKQVKDFFGFLWSWVDPLTRLSLPESMPYATQLWTIPVELKCSLITWVTILGVAKCSPMIRLGTITFLCVYFHIQMHPEAPLFLAGTILAEVHLIRQDTAKPAEETPLRKLRDTVIFIIGLVLASYPRHGGRKGYFTAPLWVIAKMTVGDKGKIPLYLWTTIAAALLVWVVSQSLFLQRMFTTPVARYLGKVSFSLYCVHMFLINWFGYRLIIFFWTIFGNDTTFRYELGIGVAFIFQATITMWVADVFMRAVDMPSVELTRWIEQRCLAEH